jgi:hypothetical protein
MTISGMDLRIDAPIFICRGGGISIHARACCVSVARTIPVSFLLPLWEKVPTIRSIVGG